MALYHMVEPALTCFFELALLRRHYISHSLLQMGRNVGSRCLSLIGYPHPWITVMRMTHCEDNPLSSRHTVPLWRAGHAFHRGKKTEDWSLCSSGPTQEQPLALWISHVVAKCPVTLQEEWWGDTEIRRPPLSMCWPPGPGQEVFFPSTEGTCCKVCLTQPKQPMGVRRLQFVALNLETVMKINGTRHIKSAP